MSCLDKDWRIEMKGKWNNRLEREIRNKMSNLESDRP